jgi:hypothetical protein
LYFSPERGWIKLDSLVGDRSLSYELGPPLDPRDCPIRLETVYLTEHDVARRVSMNGMSWLPISDLDAAVAAIRRIGSAIESIGNDLSVAAAIESTIGVFRSKWNATQSYQASFSLREDLGKGLEDILSGVVQNAIGDVVFWDVAGFPFVEKIREERVVGVAGRLEPVRRGRLLCSFDLLHAWERFAGLDLTRVGGRFPEGFSLRSEEPDLVTGSPWVAEVYRGEVLGFREFFVSEHDLCASALARSFDRSRHCLTAVEWVGLVGEFLVQWFDGVVVERSLKGAGGSVVSLFGTELFHPVSVSGEVLESD